MKGDTRSLDSSSYGVINLLAKSPDPPSKPWRKVQLAQQLLQLHGMEAMVVTAHPGEAV